jgi:hypothetical protein
MNTAKFLMQARSSADGHLYTWRALTRDFLGVGYTGPGSPLDVCVAGGGFEYVPTVPDKSITLSDGSYVVLSDGSYAVTT